MNTIKAIIVDDEVDARKVLGSLINMSKIHVDILAQCTNVPEAVSAIKQYAPDVVFLDVQMPDYAGYEIINFFDEINFEIVFVTAYDEFALKAFELSAIDYLVKPISRGRLNETLKRLSEKLRDKNNLLEYGVLLDNLKSQESKKIVIKGSSENKILNLQDIICIKGEGSYSLIYLKNTEKITVSKNLKYFEKTLPANTFFFRSQKSWIVNLLEVNSYNLRKGNLNMSNDLQAKISINRVEEFEILLEQLKG